MFTSKKKLKETIKKQDEIIKAQATFMPAFEKLKIALEKYEQILYIASENESKFIHAALKTAVGMVIASRSKIITDIKTEMAKLPKFYIEKILQEAIPCEDQTKPTEQ